jgi:hypothetical protein
MPDAVPAFGAVESLLCRRCMECFPDVPSEVSDVDISGEWALTWADRPHLAVQVNNWGITVFLTKQNVKILLQCDTIFVDGTFRTAPHPYAQLLTIHGLFRDVVVPLAFCLISGRTTAHYRQVLQPVAYRGGGGGRPGRRREGGAKMGIKAQGPGNDFFNRPTRISILSLSLISGIQFCLKFIVFKSDCRTHQ